MDYGSIVSYLVDNFGWISLVITLIVTCLVEAIKIPFKKLTAKISNERLRKLANKSIILLAFGIAFLLEWAGAKWLPQFISYSSAAAMVEGAFSNIFYLLGEGVITTKQASEAVSKVEASSSDTATDEDKKSAVDEFKNLINK